MAQRAPSGKMGGGTRYPSSRQGGPHSCSLLGHLGCPSEPRQAPGQHAWNLRHSFAALESHPHHFVRTTRSKAALSASTPTLGTLAPLMDVILAILLTFTSLLPFSQQDESARCRCWRGVQLAGVRGAPGHAKGAAWPLQNGGGGGGGARHISATQDRHAEDVAQASRQISATGPIKPP